MSTSRRDRAARTLLFSATALFLAGAGLALRPERAEPSPEWTAGIAGSFAGPVLNKECEGNDCTKDSVLSCQVTIVTVGGVPTQYCTDWYPDGPIQDAGGSE